MPSLTKRRSASMQPLTRETANPNAATAAASAFLNRDPNMSLSSAAAAAALRARPTTPTNVAEVQSKRAHRRSPSLSSQSSRDRLSHREVRRTPSVGSMAERTFRSRSSSRSPAPRERNVPPVPTLPHIDRAAANKTASGGRPRAASVQTQPFKTASERMRDGQHSSWFGGATAGDVKNVRKSDVMARSASVAAPEPRAGSVSPSINFSYPRAKTHSPSPSFDDQTLIYDPNSRRMVTRGELLARSHDIPEFTERPKKKKQEVGRAGSHLSRGTVGRTQAPALEASQSQLAEQQRQPLEETPVSEQQVSAPANLPQEPAKKRKKKKKKQAIVSKQTPIVAPAAARDEEEMTEDDMPPPASNSSNAVEGPDNMAQEEEEERLALPQDASAASTRPEPGNGPSNGDARKPESKRLGSTRLTRESSASPARSARFATNTEQLLIRHEPPPRSVSPKKSAMKLSSQRDMWPDEDESEAEGRCLSPQQPEESSVARKKRVRVSWDDNKTVVVGESNQPHDADVPFVPSPQARKPWHSIVTKYTKKDAVNLSEDETMSPRPALPLFGSVREKRTKETEERPLVRPLERSASMHASSETGARPDIGQSSDAVIGAAITQDQASRNAANISKYREPLPPVTSADGNSKGLNPVESSDDDLDSDYTEHEDVVGPTPPKTSESHVLEPPVTEPPASKPHSPEPVTSEVLASEPRVSDSVNPEPDTSEPPASEPNFLVKDKSDAGSHTNEAMPTTGLSGPSPGSEDRKNSASSVEKLSVPGRFPVDNDSPVREAAGYPLFEPSTAANDVAVTQPSRSTEPAIAPGGGAMEDIVEEEEDTDRCSVYSDAYEDPADADGDGFLSLDAVVESPPPNKVSKTARERAQSPVAEDEADKESRPPRSRKQEPPRPINDWENAKAYWRSLSADERRQLEYEALSEASEDEDEEPTPPRKARHTKSRSEPSNSPLQDPYERSYQIKPGTKWSGDISADDSKKRHTVAANQPGPRSAGGSKFRHSMRGDQLGTTARASGEQAGGMKKSLRGSTPQTMANTNGATRKTQQPASQAGAAAAAGGASMRKSMRPGGYNGEANGARPALSQTGRPASYQSLQSNRPVKMHKQNLSVEDLRGGIRPSLRRRGSDDSVSSFTRSRATSTGGHGFRMSMRASMPEPVSGATRSSGRFSLRSMSPPAFPIGSFTSAPATPSSLGSGGRMRNSLRTDPAPTSPIARLSPFKRSPGGRKGVKSKSSSRFADSSDEDDAGPSIFSSRFADSSDEEEVPRPRFKAKGMVKTMRGASQPLPTLSQMRHDMDHQSLRGASGNDRSSSLHRSGSGRGTLVPLPPPIPDDEVVRPSSRRGSLMSILRRKKDTSGKISRSAGESGARRDTNLERSTEQLGAIRSNGSHQRGPSWPLPDEEDEDEEEEESVEEPSRDQQQPLAAGQTRPSTSGGPASSIGAKIPFHRRNTSQGMTGLGHERQDGDALDQALPPPKKKKFGALRKMFGIHD